MGVGYWNQKIVIYDKGYCVALVIEKKKKKKKKKGEKTPPLFRRLAKGAAHGFPKRTSGLSAACAGPRGLAGCP
ncbi:MAG: hypothetical protein KDK56_10875, partial [Simkania sp.]|nr:hypothetical protein [Simkania sp.]